MGKLCFLGAHPDDETFMMGSTLAKYANAGHQIKIICATKGEAGQWSDVIQGEETLAHIRSLEHKKGLQMLGVEDIEYLGFTDGTIANQDINPLTDKISELVNIFKPDVIVAPDINGISGHIDHIAMAIVSARVFQKVSSIKKLYYYVLLQDEKRMERRSYWGREMKEVTTFVDVEDWVNRKIEASVCHKTQQRDTERLVPFWKEEKTDHYILIGSRVETKLPETDLFSGV